MRASPGRADHSLGVRDSHIAIVRFSSESVPIPRDSNIARPERCARRAPRGANRQRATARSIRRWPCTITAARAPHPAHQHRPAGIVSIDGRYHSDDTPMCQMGTHWHTCRHTLTPHPSREAPTAPSAASRARYACRNRAPALPTDFSTHRSSATSRAGCVGPGAAEDDDTQPRRRHRVRRRRR